MLYPLGVGTSAPPTAPPASPRASLVARLVAGLASPALRRRVLLGALCFALSFIPLVGTLGYFSALVLGPVLAVMGVLAGVDAVRNVRGKPAPRATEPLGALARHGGPDLAWLAGIPLAVLTVGMLYNRNCDPLTGVAFYLVGPVASLLVGSTAGAWAGALTRAETPRWRQVLLGLVPMAVSVGTGLALLYTQPVVYAYDAWIGWFSGPIYDEVVSVRRTFLRFRLYNAMLVAAAWFFLGALLGPAPSLRLQRLGDGRRGRLGVAVCALAIGVWMGWQPTRFGFTTTHASTERTLAATRETEHFIIRYRPGSATAREIDWVAAEHEFAWHRLERQLGRAPDGKITSYIFPDPDTKRRVFGAGRVEVSLPWKREMYLRHLPFPHDVMHHELAHSFGATIGDPLFGLSARMGITGPRLNMGLIEGFAVAMAPRSRHGLDIHDQAAVLDRLDKRPRLGPIMGLGFYGKASGRAYTAAGSFVSWLLETRGPEPLAELYRSAGDFESAYAASLPELERDWVAFLRARPIDDDDVAKMEARFNQPAIFRRPCAHRSATVLGEANRARRRGDGDEAVALIEGLCSLEPEQPNHRIALGDTLAILERYEAAAQAYRDAADLPAVPQTIRASIAARMGDVALVAGDALGAREAYARAAKLSSGEAIQRGLDIKTRATHDPDVIPVIIDYFRPFEPPDRSDADGIVRMYAATLLRDRPGWIAIGSYLTARQLMNTGRPDLALPALERALNLERAESLPPGEPPLMGDELVDEAKRLLVDARLRTGDYDGARAMLEELSSADELRSGDRLNLALWRERVDFYERYFDGE